MSQTVKPGYKQTEVGVIPEEWEAGGLGRFWSVTDCKHVTAQFVPQGIPLASIREVQSRFVELTNAKKTTAYYYNLLIEGGRKPCPGDLILSRNATVGEVAQVAEWHPPFAMGQDVCLLRKKAPDHSTDFLQAVFQSPVILDQLANLMVGSTFKRANVEQIRNFAVPMPSPAEQRAIATALSDVDALLAALDRLIAKKRDLKQAAMQQLLTGQTRLPGFTGKWETKRLGDVVQIQKGQLITSSTLLPGDVPVIAGGKQPAYFHAVANRHGRTITISASGASAGYVALYNEPIFASDCSTVSEAEAYSLDFIYYKLLSIQEAIYKAQTGGAQPHIHAKDLNPIPISMPPLPEQTAIATVLSDMDLELAALEQRRDKTRALKQGMMQELLTGRTRLI
jgi:type I restriction enzyme S subunit